MARPMSRKRRRSRSMFDRPHMLPSSERAAPLMSEAVTTRRARRRSAGRRQSAGWTIALAASALVHLGILIAFVAYGRSSEPLETAEGPLDGQRPALLPVPIAVAVEVTDIEVTGLPPAEDRKST